MKKRLIQLLFSTIFCIALMLGFSSCELFAVNTKHIHEYTNAQTFSATCTKEGYVLRTCACGEEITETLPPIGHEFSEYISNDNATCDNNATETAICARENCEEKDEREIENSALGHDFIDYRYNKPIDKVFTKTSKCARENCNATDTITATEAPSVLVYTSTTHEADFVTSTLLDEGYQVSAIQVENANDLPETQEQLQAFEQVIFVNIANADIPTDFDVLLTSYVEEGGSFLSVGGDNAYNRVDMYGSLYQELLPVNSINYTPPTAVMFVMDTSGSMSAIDNNGKTRLENAKTALASALNSFTERDYVGIITLGDTANVVLPLTPCTQASKILAAISSIESAEGGTLFTPSIERAGKELRAIAAVDKRHIVTITDGAFSDDPEIYQNVIESYHETDGITLSIIALDVYDSGSVYAELDHITQLGGGNLYCTTNDIAYYLDKDLSEIKSKDVAITPFTVIIPNEYAQLYQVTQADMPTLSGFNGTKLKEGATLILSGSYSMPIYAEWNYGNGRVGSFACDLNGTWSSEFITSETGHHVFVEILNSLIFA